MAAPNIVNVATITGNTTSAELTNSLTAVLDNAAASDDVYKINSIIVSHKTGSTDQLIRGAFSDNGTDRYLAYDVDLIAKTSIVVISKDSGFYLEEGDSIKAYCDANSQADIIISYEILTD